MKRIEITMGRNTPNNGKVSDKMMNDFIKSDIMPFFDYGTFIDGEGFWKGEFEQTKICLLYTSPSPRDRQKSRMPSSA